MRIFVLTGAGISAESGLGTFRDKGGLWARFDPMKPWLFRTYCRPFHGGEVERALPHQPRQGPDRPLRRLRPADADRLRQRPRPRRGEVGKVGVPISHLGDMRALFDGIPLER
jgi:methylmalonyl-CoA mutase N-terminal domain/subunit